MNAEEDEKKEEANSKGFKVDDRRRFSAEGELKPQHRDAESADQPASPAGASAAAAQAAQTQGAGTSTAAASIHREPTAEISFETAFSIAPFFLSDHHEFNASDFC